MLTDNETISSVSGGKLNLVYIQPNYHSNVRVNIKTFFSFSHTKRRSTCEVKSNQNASYVDKSK